MVRTAVKAGKGAYGDNAATGDYGDMLEAGILDPTNVTRLAAARVIDRWSVSDFRGDGRRGSQGRS